MSAPDVHARFASLLWNAGDADELLAILCGGRTPARKGVPADTKTDPAAFSAWIDAAARLLGRDTIREDLRHQQLQWFLRTTGPALIRWPHDESRYLGIVRGSRRHVIVVAREGSFVSLPVQVVRDVLAEKIEAPHAAELHRLLDAAAIHEKHRDAVRDRMLGDRLAFAQVTRGWRLDRHPAHGVLALARAANLPRQILAFIALYATQYSLWLLSWWVVANWTLEDLSHSAWSVAWLLLLLTVIPLQLFCTWFQGVLSLKIGTLIRQQLLAGAMRVDPDVMRAEGPSQLLSRVLESNVVENAILTGGFLGITGVIEVLFAGAVLASGATGGWHAALLGSWLVLFLIANAFYYRRRRTAAIERIEMTHDLVERMVGHRTIAAQERAENLHRHEDARLGHYYASSVRMDRWAAVVEVLSSHAWTFAALFLLVPFVVRGMTSPLPLAITIGGIVLAERALQKCAGATWQGIDAAIAWNRVAPILDAATREDIIGDPQYAIPDAAGSGALIDARDLSYGYGSAGSVVKGWSMRIDVGDRLLLEGRSGSGKSTLCALLTGLRRTQRGTILLQGLDVMTTGESLWRKRIVAAPQFHENHIIAETFAFNLLMGRRWPPTAADLKEAQEVCRELGLGPLLDRMPGKMFQMIGDTGWQLSHGERSRLFIARALLGRPDLLILDESFAALDPASFDQSMECVLRRASTLMVVAHP